MPLVELPLPRSNTDLPRDIRMFLRSADRRIEDFQHSICIPAFVPSDFPRVYDVLQSIAAESLAPGQRICEWGSGFGVVAGLAAMLGFEAWGIEIESKLVDAARKLCGDFDVPAEFVHGSFIPRGGDDLVEAGGPSAWLTPESDDSYEEIGLDPDDFDVVFTYPWPHEEEVVFRLFERFTAPGAILVTFHGADDIRLRRKTSRTKKRSRRKNHG